MTAVLVDANVLLDVLTEDPRWLAWSAEALERAAEVAVLALEKPGSGARRIIEQEIERALAEDGAEAIVLGCAGMTDLARDLERKAGVPVLDGVACAVSLAESLVRLGLRTSKRGAYAPPLAKPYAGQFKRFSPK